MDLFSLVKFFGSLRFLLNYWIKNKCTDYDFDETKKVMQMTKYNVESILAD